MDWVQQMDAFVMYTLPSVNFTTKREAERAHHVTEETGMPANCMSAFSQQRVYGEKYKVSGMIRFP